MVLGGLVEGSCVMSWIIGNVETCKFSWVSLMVESILRSLLKKLKRECQQNKYELTFFNSQT